MLIYWCKILRSILLNSKLSQILMVHLSKIQMQLLWRTILLSHMKFKTDLTKKVNLAKINSSRWKIWMTPQNLISQLKCWKIPQTYRLKVQRKLPKSLRRRHRGCPWEISISLYSRFRSLMGISRWILALNRILLTLSQGVRLFRIHRMK